MPNLEHVSKDGSDGGPVEQFLNIALGFPTVIWTVLLGIMLAYWLFVMLGALDVELFDIDIDFDTDFDLDVDVDMDVDADVDSDIDAPTGASPWLQAAVALGIGKVPLTILATFLVGAAWASSFLAMYYLAPLAQLGIVAAPVFGGSVVIGIASMGILAQPLKEFFTNERRTAGASLIGEVCVVMTGSVTDSFGQARFDDGGAGLLLSVRCENDNDLGRQAQALIIGHDREQNIYWVEPYAQFLEPEKGESSASSVDAVMGDLVHAKREV